MTKNERDERYTTTAAAARLSIVGATIKNWSNTYAAFLSPSARPEKGKTRVFTVEDLRVFQTIARLRRERKEVSDIIFVLRTGERDDLPPAAESAIAPYPPALLELRREVATLQGEIERLSSENEQKLGSIRTYEKLLEQKEQRIRDLYRELALLELRLREATYKRPRASKDTGAAGEDQD